VAGSAAVASAVRTVARGVKVADSAAVASAVRTVARSAKVVAVAAAPRAAAGNPSEVPAAAADGPELRSYFGPARTP